MTMVDLIERQNSIPANWRDYELQPLTNFRREMGRFFDGLFQAPLTAAIPAIAGWLPIGLKIEVKDGDKEVIVTAELAGLTEKDVELFFDKGMLMFVARRRARKTNLVIRSASTESSSGQFRCPTRSTPSTASPSSPRSCYRPSDQARGGREQENRDPCGDPPLRPGPTGKGPPRAALFVWRPRRRMRALFSRPIRRGAQATGGRGSRRGPAPGAG